MKKQKTENRIQESGATGANFVHPSSVLKRLTYQLLPVADYLKLKFSRSRVAIHGSYFTTNVGDRTIGIVLRGELKKSGISSTLVSRFCSHPMRSNIVVGGGGVIHNHYDRNIELRTSFVENDKRVVYIGVGCPGFKNLLPNEKVQLKKLERARYVSVRDQRSKQVLIEELDIDPEILACPAWLINRHLKASDFSLRNTLFLGYYNLKYRSRKSDSAKSKKKKLGVVLNGHFDPVHLNTIKTMLKQLCSEYSLYFIPFVGEDLEFSREHLSDIPMTYLKLNGPVATYNAILGMDRVIATRYHSAIFSLLAEKPVMILAYSEKLISLAKDLELSYVDLWGSQDQNFTFNEQVNVGLIQGKISEAEMQIQRIISHLE